jgi:hypothetical protein
MIFRHCLSRRLGVLLALLVLAAWARSCFVVDQWRVPRQQAIWPDGTTTELAFGSLAPRDWFLTGNVPIIRVRWLHVESGYGVVFISWSVQDHPLATPDDLQSVLGWSSVVRSMRQDQQYYHSAWTRLSSGWFATSADVPVPGVRRVGFVGAVYQAYAGRNGGVSAHARSLRLPYWIPTLLFGLPPAVTYVRRRRRRKPGHCRHCGYDLRASPERCPECGHPSS